MRTEEKWNSHFRKSAIQAHFPPRIANDLIYICNEKDTKLKGSFFIYGEIATGKTILASQIMLASIKQAYMEDTSINAIFVSFPNLLMELRTSFNNKNGNTESEIMKRYLECDLLVLDDFMTTRPTDWVVDVMYHLINHRYEYIKTTIITSNKTLPELEVLLGDQRITSRIDRMCKSIEKLPY